MTQQLTKAILLTGAAARISQEVAIFDQLQIRKGLTVSQDDTLLAGFSSGSLNLAAINACFSTGSNLPWDDYYKKQVLFPIRNKDVYKITSLPFDTTPLKNTLTTFLNKMNCQKVGDLAFYSSILSFSWNELDTLWACSNDMEQYYINSLDMFMASTAIPVVFPSQQISCVEGQTSNFPDGQFADGGTGGCFINFGNSLGKYVSNNGQFDVMYIISPMREKAEKEKTSFDKYLTKKKIAGVESSKMDLHLENISLNGFLKFLKKLDEWECNGQPMAKEIYVCIPQMAKNSFIMNFNKQEKKYNDVKEWVLQNPDKLAIPLKQYLEEHNDEIV